MKSILLISIFWLSGNLYGQNTILWKVNHPDGKTQSHLLGTFHQMGNSFVDSIPKIKELLFSSDIAFFESIDPTDSLRANLNKRADQFEYQKILGKSDVKFLETYSAAWSVPISKLTPIELFIKLNQEYILKTCGTAQVTDQWLHFDKYLIYLAQEREIPIQGLETDPQQTRDINEMASGYDWKSAKNDIEYVVNNIKKSKTNTTPCERAQQYMNFELDYEFEAACEDANLLERNQKWMPTILNSVEHQNTFIAVGLLHLYGTCGLIEQLRKNGYKVEPIALK